MFNSLRSRLILSYVLVVVLTLLIAGAGLLLLLQDYQQGITMQKLEAALGPAVVTAREALRQGRTLTQTADDIQDQVEKGWRVWIVDAQGVIVADSQRDLVGRSMPRPLGQQTIGGQRFLSGSQRVAGRQVVYAGTVITRAGQPSAFLVLTTVARPFIGALEDLAGPLSCAGATALVVAVLIGLVLARSISEPLRRLTRATEEIARGNFEGRIPVEGNDETGRLAESFNAMTSAVKHSQEVQRDFVANVSHELKTPLTSIQGFAQAIEEGAIRDLEGARRAAKMIHDESQRMTRLVSDLLTLARLDAGAIGPQFKTLDLAAMLPEWVARFQTRAEQAGVSLTLAMDSPPPVEGDAERLEQVIANLIDNSIKYNRVGGQVVVRADAQMRIESSSRSLFRKGIQTWKEWAVIRVSDTGAGIPKSHLPRLFERFYRGDQARLAGGIGLGLAIAQEIVKAHHGRIEVQSDEDKGATFSVWLPAKT